MLPFIPLLLQILSKGSASSIIEDCYEFLYLVANAQEDGIRGLYESGGIQLFASQMPSLPDGTNVVKYAMELVQLMISKLPAGEIYVQYPSELAMLVVEAARRFGLLHSDLKFKALHLLSVILSSQYSVPVREALRSMDSTVWSTNMRAGVVAILNSRVAPADKLQALFLSECAISIVGEEWLTGPVELQHIMDPIPASRCIQLVFETSRVEISVLLNDLAYLRDEASKSCASLSTETTASKCRNLGVMYSLIEAVIKLISKYGDDEESSDVDVTISDSILMKIISGLNETISVVLEYLQDAKEHGQNRGDDLLASVRIIGRYLAETPDACREKVKELLGFMLSVQGGDEVRPFYSTCFLLPMLCQITMRSDGCELFVSSGAFEAVIEYLRILISPGGGTAEDDGALFLACDTVLNFLLNGAQLRSDGVDASLFELLGALAGWAVKANDYGIIMMASSICAVILDSTSEEALLGCKDVSKDDVNQVSQLMRKSLVGYGKGLVGDGRKGEEVDLYEIVAAGYCRWGNRFPSIKGAIERET
ncbi:OLC1v1027949C1 [Oldenlandia corymbosa var. corymbosa]|nr:OLC1v1027949C1 [Oldenlandia corymbosa var. corymbosa]